MKKNYLLFFSAFLMTIMPLFLSAQEDVMKVSKNDFKVTLLSLGSGSSRFTYERAFTPRNSAELTVGVIGWGFDIMNGANPRGVLFKMAVKYNVLPQKSAKQSWLAGFYVKPELVVADYDYETDKEVDGAIIARGAKSVGYRNKAHTTQFALLAEGGYQLVLWKWFVFDVYAGLGPSFGTGNMDNYYHSFMRYPKDSWLAFTAGFRVGVAF